MSASRLVSSWSVGKWCPPLKRINDAVLGSQFLARRVLPCARGASSEPCMWTVGIRISWSQAPVWVGWHIGGYVPASRTPKRKCSFLSSPVCFRNRIPAATWAPCENPIMPTNGAPRSPSWASASSNFLLTICSSTTRSSGVRVPASFLHATHRKYGPNPSKNGSTPGPGADS